MMECDASKCDAACCKLIVFKPEVISKDLHEYYLAHGCEIKDGWVTVPSRCRQLTEDNKCRIHAKKPFLCRAFGNVTIKGAYIPETCVYYKGLNFE